MKILDLHEHIICEFLLLPSQRQYAPLACNCYIKSFIPCAIRFLKTLEVILYGFVHLDILFNAFFIQ